MMLPMRAARRQVHIPEELLQWYENAIDRENADRAKRRLVPLSGTDLLRIVLARFAGFPVTHDLDLDAIQAKSAVKMAPMKTTARKTTTKKAPTKGRQVEQKA